MKILGVLITMIFAASSLYAQQPERKANVRPELRKGNKLYAEKKYKEAQGAYMSAIKKDPTSYTGIFNLGDALYNDKNYEQARQAMEAGAKTTKDKKEQARAYHNIGNTFLEEKKWEDAAKAFKQSLRLDPTDADTKYNLAYANAMIKKDGGKDKNNDKDKKDQDKKDQDKKDQDKKDQDKKDQDKKDQDKKDGDKKDDQDKKDGDKKDDQDKGDKDKPEQQRPQGQPSKLSQQQAENLLNALRQEEKKLQDKKEKGKGVPVKMEKDW